MNSMTLKLVDRLGVQEIYEMEFVRFDPQTSTVYLSDDPLDTIELQHGNTAYVMNSRGNTVAIWRSNGTHNVSTHSGEAQ